MDGRFNPQQPLDPLTSRCVTLLYRPTVVASPSPRLATVMQLRLIIGGPELTCTKTVRPVRTVQTSGFL